MDQPGKVANPARGQLNRGTKYVPVRVCTVLYCIVLYCADCTALRIAYCTVYRTVLYCTVAVYFVVWGWATRHYPSVLDTGYFDLTVFSHTYIALHSRRYFQHAHFIPMVCAEKRGAYELVHGDLPRQHSFGTTLRFTGPVPADSRQ